MMGFSSTMLKSVAALLLIAVCACGSSNSANTSDTGTLADGGSADDGGDRTDAGPHGGGADGPMATIPTVASTTPGNGAADVPLNATISATFSEAMDPASLTTTTFSLTAGTTAVPGAVFYANSRALFGPASRLASHQQYTATITTGAKSVLGAALGAVHSWTFTTGSTLAPLTPVNLGSAGNFVILSQSGISTMPDSTITGNLGISPAAASYITGFSLAADSTNVFSRTPQVTGKVYAADYAAPTPANLTTAIGDMQIAFSDAASRAPDVTELGAGDIGGKTIAPGVYKWGTGLLIPTDVTLAGTATDIWIFQIAQDLTVSSAKKVVLAPGVLSKNVFWQVSGKVVLGTTSHVEGIVLTQTAITLATGSSIEGRLFAQTAVTLAGSTVVEPAP